MIRTTLVLAAALVAIASNRVLASTASTEVVIKSSLGANGEYNGNLTYVVQYFGGITRNDLAVQFTPTGSDFLLTAARLALFRQVAEGPVPQLVLTDDLQRAPGAPIASAALENIPVERPFEVDTGLYDVDWLPQQILLRQDQPYWFVLTQTAPSPWSEIRWFVNSVDDRSQWASNNYNTTTGEPNPWVNNDLHQILIPGFSVVGVPVPEPTAALLSAVAAGVVLLRNQRG